MSDNKESKLTEQEQELMDKVIKDGQKIVFPERADQWEDYVRDRFKDVYIGKDAVDALTIIEALNRGDSVDDAKKMLEEMNQSGSANGLIRRAVLLFADRGPEFWKNTSQGHISLRTRWQLFKISRENARLKKYYSYTLPAGDVSKKTEEDSSPSWILDDDEMQIVNEKQNEIGKIAMENIKNGQVQIAKEQSQEDREIKSR